MKTLFTLLIAAGLLGVAAGCTDEQQLEQAQEDLVEERSETAEVVREAREDGVVTPDEREDLIEEQGDDAAAAGEMAEQQGELIESQTD